MQRSPERRAAGRAPERAALLTVSALAMPFVLSPCGPPIRAQEPAAAPAAPTAPPAPAAATAPAPPPGWKPGDPIPSLAAAYRGQFLVGAAVTGAMVQGDAQGFVKYEFNVIVSENEMKPSALSRGEGKYDFSRADALVDWANRNGIKVRGHCLVWHRDELPWMFTSGSGPPLTGELVAARMRTYIHDVVGHFKGRVWAWDVVNEALVAYEPGVDDGSGWRKSGWYRYLGKDYVPLAFQYAHEADPDALLFYNDYETQSPAKRALIMRLIRTLQAKNIPIHGIGHQSHYSLDWPPARELEATIQEVAAAGLRNHVTELDISLRPRGNGEVPALTDALKARQAARWAELFRMFRRNQDKIDAVLTWGVNVKDSWLGPPDQPLLFSDYVPTAAFWAVLDAAAR
ncbi:MAG TPA: endo-1,4-beta-xylanase [Kofleriaceae bacterium]|nr:endo-1,4-beta-xylanase [Kofleriaceae bacterium]